MGSLQVNEMDICRLTVVLPLSSLPLERIVSDCLKSVWLMEEQGFDWELNLLAYVELAVVDLDLSSGVSLDHHSQSRDLKVLLSYVEQ